jgi:hypothetical protein
MLTTSAAHSQMTFVGDKFSERKDSHCGNVPLDVEKREADFIAASSFGK